MKFHSIASVKPKNNLCVSESHTSSKSKTSLCIQYFLTIFILIFLFVCFINAIGAKFMFVLSVEQ